MLTKIAAAKSVVPIVNYRRLRNIVVPIPPRPIQDRIAAVMQDAYNQRREKLAATDELVEEMKLRVDKAILKVPIL